jgi:hypothetical protein
MDDGRKNEREVHGVETRMACLALSEWDWLMRKGRKEENFA